MRNSVLVAVVSAVVVVLVVACGIWCGVSDVSTRMEMAERADAMEYVGVDTSYYAYCDAVDRADSLEMVYEFVDSVYYHVKDSLISCGVDNLNFNEEYISMWRLYTDTDMEYFNAKIDAKYAKKAWLRHQEEYDNKIKQLRNNSEDNMGLIVKEYFYGIALIIVCIICSCVYEQVKNDEKKEEERRAWEERNVMACPVWILENGDVTLKKVRVVLNKYCTERDMYENYVESCADFHISNDMCMTFEQWLSCCE